MKKAWGYIVGFVALVFGVLVYVLNLKNKKLNALKAEVALADTREKVVVLEEKIRVAREQVGHNEVKIDEIDEALSELEQKKKALAREAGAASDKEVELFWKEH